MQWRPGERDLDIQARCAAYLEAAGADAPVLIVGGDDRLERFRHPMAAGAAGAAPGDGRGRRPARRAARRPDPVRRSRPAGAGVRRAAPPGSGRRGRDARRLHARNAVRNCAGIAGQRIRCDWGGRRMDGPLSGRPDRIRSARVRDRPRSDRVAVVPRADQGRPRPRLEPEPARRRESPKTPIW